MKNISLQVIAACSGLSHDTLQRRIHRGDMPPPDSRTHKGLSWRLSTIRAWNPQVAARIERGITTEIFAFRSAA